MKTLPRIKSCLILGILSIFLIGFALVAYRMISGRSLGLKSLLNYSVYSIESTVKSLANQRLIQASTTGNYNNVIFLHHSVGNNLIEQGGVRELLTQEGYNFWDHSYNAQGLRDPEGKFSDYSYNIPEDNTDPDGLAKLFNQRVFSLLLNAFSRLLQHEVIIIKSCYPASNITSDDLFNLSQAWYLDIRGVMDQHPDKIFIIVTQPPLNPAETDLETAARARHLAQWLASPEFLDGHPNIFTFDFFYLLAENDLSAPDAGMLRSNYRIGTDSHPNRLANETIGPVFVDFVIQAVNEYRK